MGGDVFDLVGKPLQISGEIGRNIIGVVPQCSFVGPALCLLRLRRATAGIGVPAQLVAADDEGVPAVASAIVEDAFSPTFLTPLPARDRDHTRPIRV